MTRLNLALAAVLFLVWGCSSESASPSKGEGAMEGGTVKMTPGPGNATADQRVGSKLGP